MKFLIQTHWPPYNLYQKFISGSIYPSGFRGLIVKVYRGQQTPSCSNTSHDHYNLHWSCVPDLCHTRWLFIKNSFEMQRTMKMWYYLDCLLDNITFCSILHKIYLKFIFAGMILFRGWGKSPTPKKINERGSSRCNTSFCRKLFNEHSYHVTFGFNLPGGFRGEDYI
jgi:hypothetical protein